jgi:predicted membrane protein
MACDLIGWGQSIYGIDICIYALSSESCILYYIQKHIYIHICVHIYINIYMYNYCILYIYIDMMKYYEYVNTTPTLKFRIGSDAMHGFAMIRL